MFTGIVETQSAVLGLANGLLRLARPVFFKNLKKGQSIAVNGCCLSVNDFSKNKIEFCLMHETLNCTNLGQAKVVNLERALPASGRFEGHMVAGHVDGVLEFLRSEGERFYFQMPPDFPQFFVHKGSVALNGVSLTVASENEKEFCICLIDQTLEKTNLGKLQTGDIVNFECDLLAKFFLKSLREK